MTQNKYILKKPQIGKNPKFETYLIEEAKLFEKLQHVSGLIKYHGLTHETVTNSDNCPSMVLEYCQYGSLQQL